MGTIWNFSSRSSDHIAAAKIATVVGGERRREGEQGNNEEKSEKGRGEMKTTRDEGDTVSKKRRRDTKL